MSTNSTDSAISSSSSKVPPQAAVAPVAAAATVAATSPKRRFRKQTSDVAFDQYAHTVQDLSSLIERQWRLHTPPSQQPSQSLQVPSPFAVDPTKLFSVDAEINHDILVLIRGYLRRCGLHATATTLKNESSLNVKQTRTTQRLVREAVLEGDWESLRETAKTGPVPRLRRAFTYLVNKQEFLELVNKQESQRAFALLISRLKPHETQARVAGDDFRDLAYLATCRSVTDAPAFRNWDGVTNSRKRLARELCGMVNRNDLFRQQDDGQQQQQQQQHQAGNGEGGEGEDDHDNEDGDFLLSNKPTSSGAQQGAGDAGTDSEDDLDSLEDDNAQSTKPPVRLITLLQQAYAYQVEKKTQSGFPAAAAATTGSRAQVPPNTGTTAPPSLHTTTTPRVTSLLVDFTAPMLPDGSRFKVLSGHEQSVKCLEFIPGRSSSENDDDDRRLIASGSSDGVVCLWDFAPSSSPSSTDSTRKTFLKGHSGRVWDLSASKDGTLLASVSADSTLKVWDTSKIRTDEAFTVVSRPITTQHSGDAYSVCFHPESRAHVVTAGHDQTVRLIDIEHDRVIKVFRGHSGSVVHAIFNPVGNLIVTGSKDSTVKFFDVVSGVCVKTMPQLLGAVTSVQLNRAGDKLLTGTKDSSNRLWDIRTGTVLSRFKGHVNSSKNFIRAQFGSCDQIVLGGSEDGAVYVWDADSGKMLDRLVGHSGSVFRAVWSHQWNMLGSCSEDGTVRLWDAKGGGGRWES